ncbi:hypothetical protein SLS62_002721 [Diatrype stigma]|uniref:Sulphur transport domain-containing protein n=1 Tax=Diatrype stigma TaxID=117547 RepID=A0AAN9UWK8_9PEZI
MFDDFLTGAVFGAALRASGVHEPAIIASQLNATNWHMVQTFLAGSGTSVLLVALIQRLGYLRLKPRDYSSLGLFARCDGNILGGLLLGAGMALSGSCPGTVFVQLGAGIPSGFYTLAGCVLGGMVWSGILGPALKKRTKTAVVDKPNKTNRPQLAQLTIFEYLGASGFSTALGLTALFAAIVAIISLFAPPQTRGVVWPIAGGFLIAIAQMVSILIRNKLLGTSMSFEEAGAYFCWVIKGRDSPKPGSYGTTVLTAGMIAGALLLPLIATSASVTTLTPPIRDPIWPIRAMVGGILLALGSRMGGGCTSGHGISGVSLLSVSSFISVVAMFGGGMAVAILCGL